jgi:two-component system invasion response regulator UvrY
MKKISILIAEDHQLIRQTWSFILETYPNFFIVGECASGEQAIELVKSLRPDVVLMDINLNGMNGMDATEQIRKFYPETKVLAVSLHTQLSYARKIMQMGAMGYLTKNASRQEMVDAILHIVSGKKYICNEIKDFISEQMIDGGGESKYNSLSKRQKEIITYLQKGETSREIATALGLSAQTVEVHRHNILKKLEMKNTVALIHYINTL